MDDFTRFLHAGPDRDPATGASSIPVYQASTFAQGDVEAHGAWEYARGGNPTRAAVEAAIAAMEGGEAGFAFASGMAAISSAFLLFEAGDHVVVSDDVYGGTYRVLTTLFDRWGLAASFVDTTDPAAVRQALRPQTKGLFVETPSNPLLRITDLRAMAAIAREHGLLSLVDNTFMTPWLQRPLELGFDISLHSATKFLGGHSDVLAGLAVAREQKVGRRLKAVQNAFGAVLGPQDSWLLLRGMRTLTARMEAQQRTAQEVAAGLVRPCGHSHRPLPGPRWPPRARRPLRSGQGGGRRGLLRARGRGPRQDLPQGREAAPRGRQSRRCGEHPLVPGHDVPRFHAPRGAGAPGHNGRARAALGGARGRRRICWPTWNAPWMRRGDESSDLRRPFGMCAASAEAVGPKSLR